MLVTATVVQSCSAVAIPVLFGTYAGSADVNTSGSVTVTCTSDSPYKVRIDKGLNGSSVTARKMKSTALNATDTLNYGLFRDSGRSQPWGETDGTDTQTGTPTIANLVQAFTVYANLPAGQAVPAGGYSDTVTITIAY